MPTPGPMRTLMPTPDNGEDSRQQCQHQTMTCLPPLHLLLGWACISFFLLLFYFIIHMPAYGPLWGNLCYFRVVVVAFLTTYVLPRWFWLTLGQSTTSCGWTSPNQLSNWIELQWTGCVGFGLVICRFRIELNQFWFWFGPKMGKTGLNQTFKHYRGQRQTRRRTTTIGWWQGWGWG